MGFTKKMQFTKEKIKNFSFYTILVVDKKCFTTGCRYVLSKRTYFCRYSPLLTKN